MLRVGTIDFESDQILPRPSYPPRPAGVAIKWPGRKGRYYAWGHPTENNCTFEEGHNALWEIWNSGLPLLFHHGKFDISIATEKMGLPMLSWEQFHDSMFLTFLHDPYSPMALKPAAEKYLDMPPEERDAVHDWLSAHKKELGIASQEKNMGKYIAKAPGKLVAKYAVGDVDRAEGLFQFLYPQVCDLGMKRAYDVEREIMPILLENEQNGIRCDVTQLHKDMVIYEAALERMDDWLRKRLKAPGMNIDSGPQLAEALERSRVVTDFVLTEKGNVSTSKDNLTLDLFHDPKVFRALTYRTKLAYSLSTFMRPWMRTAEATGGTIHTNWNQVQREGAGAVTGRLSSNPNFQNMTKDPKKDGDYVHPKFLPWAPELPALRKYILPDKGQLLGVRDVSQEELRALAHFEGRTLQELYNSKNPPKDYCDKDGMVDIHQMVMHLFAGVGKELDRYDTKRMNFGILYGMGAKGMATRLSIDKRTARDFINTWNRVMPGVAELVDDIKDEVRTGGCIVTWGGRRYGMPPPLFTDGEMRNRDYVLLNYLIQGTGADILKRVWIAAKKRMKESRILLSVHDELPWSCAKRAMAGEQKVLKGIIEELEFDVPMLSDGKTGPNFGTLTKWKD